MTTVVRVFISRSSASWTSCSLRASSAEVEAAARAAELEEIVLKMPAGYDTIVGERGGRLSGGQRQRIAIARALIRNPSLIILDEATSALDPATEAAINETLERVSAGRTVVAVTHRLKSVIDYEHIFVFKEGRIIERGTHESLLRLNESYAGMWRRQNGTSVSADGELHITDVSILRDVPLFADLDEPYLRDISGMFITARVPASRTIIEEGDEGSRFYIIIRGKVAVTVTDEDANTLHVATLEDGDYFGEIALIADIPTTATVVTLTPCIFLILQREQLQKLMRQHTGLGAQLQDALTRRLSEIDAISGEQEGTQYVGK
jgi:ATP-binding cassette subfamily B protein